MFYPSLLATGLLLSLPSITEAKAFNWNKENMVLDPSGQDGSETIGSQATGLDQGFADVLRLSTSRPSESVQQPDLISPRRFHIDTALVSDLIRRPGKDEHEMKYI